MAQIVAFPRMIAFTRAFEELPLFTQRAPNGDLFYAALINGSIEISVAPNGAWWISELHIVTKDAWGIEAKPKTVRLDPDEHETLYWLILDTFTDKYTATIEEWVREATVEAGLHGRAA
jgi:hypothetical protein